METTEITSEKTAVTVGVTVWCGMCSDDIVGPIFFHGNVNGENYHQLAHLSTISLKRWFSSRVEPLRIMLMLSETF